MAALLIKGLTFGIEFQGGTVMTLAGAEGVSTEDVRDALETAGVPDAANAVIQPTDDGGLHRAHRASPIRRTAQEAFYGHPERARLPAQDVNVTTIGPGWGAERHQRRGDRTRGLDLAILAYVSIRFEYKMSVTAVLALFHDALIVLGIYALAGREVTPNTIAALLTILGYSLYDTIVVFHRIRENAAGLTKRSFMDMTNDSINEMLMRWVNTGLVQIIPILALLFFGGETLRDFAFAMAIGHHCGRLLVDRPGEPALRGLEGARAEVPGAQEEVRGAGGQVAALTRTRTRGAGTSSGCRPRQVEWDDEPYDRRMQSARVGCRPDRRGRGRRAGGSDRPLGVTASILLGTRHRRSPSACAASSSPRSSATGYAPATYRGCRRRRAAWPMRCRAGERIVVFGDFDLDGISAAATATLGLRAMGAEVEATVPHRFREGYGLTAASLERLVSPRAGLVVTVDCGFSSAPRSPRFIAQGIDVVVTDHHEPGERLPARRAGREPEARRRRARRSPAPAWRWRSCRRWASGSGSGRRGGELTDLAMLGTVADIVPLVGANRALVADGLARVRRAPRVRVCGAGRRLGRGHRRRSTPTGSRTRSHRA